MVSLKFAEPPKVVSRKLKNYFPKNRTTEGGESKVKSFWKAYRRTEPPKVVSLKLVKLKLVKKTKNRTTEGGESKSLNLRLNFEGMGHLVCSKFAFTNSFHLLVLMRLELRL